MKIGMLEHVNLRTSRLDELIDWYDRVLGMKPGWRPDFPFPGAWLYSGDNKPTVHLVGVDNEPASGLKLEHFAFSAVGLKSCVDRMKENGVDYELVAVAEANLVQVNIFDPDGNHIHIDFPAHELSDLPGVDVGGFTTLPGQRQSAL
jgi:catechol 2,3-dioxygenase-like lactoylglutathione lyase family enzyme